jgi:hypothetical protein
MLIVLRELATPDQIMQLAEEYYGLRIKLAVDVTRGIVAGGGALHYDCEQALLDDGSRQEDVWGADWYPTTQSVGYDSLINLRPKQGNRSTEIQDPGLRAQIDAIVRRLLENN